MKNCDHEPMRIQKWIAACGVASRREAERWIEVGHVKVNGALVTRLGSRIVPGKDQVTVKGRLLTNSEASSVYWLLHKPDMVLTSRVGDGRPTIYDLPMLAKAPFFVAPVGRLDYRTEGLLLLTNDGALNSKLLHPSSKVPRHYHALINGRLTRDQERKLRNGILLADGLAKPVEFSHAHGMKMGATTGSWYFISVDEGRNRLVRRIFAAFGFKVVRLVRYGLGDLRMPANLKPGDYLQLSSRQIKSLKRSVDSL